MNLNSTMEGTKMHKKVSIQDFEETVGPMNKTSIYDALVYTGLSDKKEMTVEEYQTVLAKKKKLVRSDIKHQRAISKHATKLNWIIEDEN